MINIGICDDEASVRAMIKNLCENHLNNLEKEYDIIEFHSGEEILNYSGKRLDILYLDIEMGAINGIDVMKNLLNTNTVWKIVFVTNHESAVWDSFQMKTLGFVRKSKNDSMILTYLNIILNELELNKYIIINDNHNSTTLYMEEFLYLCAEGNYTDIYTTNRKIRMWGTMKMWCDKMKTFPLAKTHKSYMVNLHNISKYYSDRLILTNGVELPVGRKYSSTVKTEYTNYMIKRIQSQ